MSGLSIAGRSSGSGQDANQVLLTVTNSSQGDMRKLREEVRAAQEEAAGRQSTKRKERPYHFQKKGHEELFSFNEVVADKLKEAEARAAHTIAEGPAKDASGQGSR